MECRRRASPCFGKSSLLALDTLRANKLRSALTVLGVVIGITAIVGMTSLDSRLRSIAARQHPAARAEHDLRRQVQRRQPRGGRNFADLARRPNLTVDDAQRDSEAGAVGADGRYLARRDGRRAGARRLRREPDEAAEHHRRHRGVRDPQLRQARMPAVSSPAPEVDHKRKVVVLGDTPYQALFAKSGLDPVEQEGAAWRRRSTPWSACSASDRRSAIGPPPG